MKLLTFFALSLFFVQVYSNCSPPCQNGGTCTLSGGVWSCNCPRNWSGNVCQSNLFFFFVMFCFWFVFYLFIDFSFLIFFLIAKERCSPGSCDNGGICTNSPDGFSCECINGFQGQFCQYGMIHFFFLFFQKKKLHDSI